MPGIKLSHLVQLLEEIAPKKLAEDWDNVGLLVGEGSREIKRILVCLDSPEWVVNEAIEKRVDFIVAHHPLIFSPLKKITTDDVTGRKLIKLIKNEIGFYGMHTNFDIVRDGMNDALASSLGLLDCETLVPIQNALEAGEVQGLGKIGTLKFPVPFGDFAVEVKRILDLHEIRVVGAHEKVVKRVAVLGGAGSKYWRKAKMKGADVLITGDVDYHEMVDVAEGGMMIIDASHFGTEKIMMEVVQQKLIKSLEEKGFSDVEVLKSEANKDVCRVI